MQRATAQAPEALRRSDPGTDPAAMPVRLLHSGALYMIRTQCADDPAELRNRSRPATVRSGSHADAEQPTGRAQMRTGEPEQHPPHFAGVDPDRPQRAATQAAAALRPQLILPSFGSGAADRIQIRRAARSLLPLIIIVIRRYQKRTRSRSGSASAPMPGALIPAQIQTGRSVNAGIGNGPQRILPSF